MATKKKEGSSFAGWLQRVRKTGEHSDLIVKIQGREFKLHMLPLVNESTYFRSLSGTKNSKNSSIIFQSSSSSNSSEGSSQKQIDRIKPQPKIVILDDLPGGASAFSIAADFCYIIRPSYTFANIGGVRAAADFLGMHDLMESTKKFLYASVFSSWRSCIVFLREYKRIDYPPSDDYIESRALRIISAACTKAFTETKHVSVPIAMPISSRSWNSSPSNRLKDLLLAAASLPDLYSNRLLELLIGADANLHIKCRQSRNIREWLDYLIRSECKRAKSRVWIVICLARMLLKNTPKNRPWLELSSQYWCSLLEHSAALLGEILDDPARVLHNADDDPARVHHHNADGDPARVHHNAAENLAAVKRALEDRIGASLHELDDYIQGYSFDPETLLALVRRFMAAKEQECGADQDQEQLAEIRSVASEVDGCLWRFAESGIVSTEIFIALEEAFPPEARPCHDALYAAVEKLLQKRRIVSADDLHRIWHPVDCSKLTSAAYDKAMSNPLYVSQPHVLECVLRKHSEELEEPSSSSSRREDMKEVLQNVIKASLKLLEENSRRSKEIKELQKQYANLVSSGFKVYPSVDSIENSPLRDEEDDEVVAPPTPREEIIGEENSSNLVML